MVNLRNDMRYTPLSILKVLAISMVVAPLSSAATNSLGYDSHSTFHKVMML
jgi:hypothetical protein